MHSYRFRILKSANAILHFHLSSHTMKIFLPYSSFDAFMYQLYGGSPPLDSASQTISVSEPISIIILRVTWKQGDERLFFLHRGIVLLTEDDLYYISSFPGIEISAGKSNGALISGVLSFSGKALNALRHPYKLKREMNADQYLLASSSRGNQSFAFGHFISEVIPDLLEIHREENNISDKAIPLLTYPLDQWAMQLLDIFNINYIAVGELPKLELSGSPTYTSYRVRGRFYRCNHRNQNLQNLILNPVNGRMHGHSFQRLIFLTRLSAGSSRPMRWSDFEDCYQATSRELPSFGVSLVDPAVGGPLKFQSSYMNGITDFFISAPGSAVYNVIYLTSSPILIAMESIPLIDSWGGQLADFKPYGHRVVFIATQTTLSVLDWDKSFELRRLPCLRCLQAIFKYMVTTTRLSSNERFVIKYDSIYISLPLASGRI